MLPILEGAPLAKRWTDSRTVISHLDVESEGAFRLTVASVVDLRHDLVAEIQRLAIDPRLLRRDHQAHERRRFRGFGSWFAELSDLVQLTDARFLVDIV